MNKELNFDFETWLEFHYNENILNLSWNEYVKRSKEYKTAILAEVKKRREKND